MDYLTTLFVNIYGWLFGNDADPIRKSKTFNYESSPVIDPIVDPQPNPDPIPSTTKYEDFLSFVFQHHVSIFLVTIIFYLILRDLIGRHRSRVQITATQISARGLGGTEFVKPSMHDLCEGARSDFLLQRGNQTTCAFNGQTDYKLKCL